MVRRTSIPWPDMPVGFAHREGLPRMTVPATFERTAGGWALGLGGRIEIVETDEEPRWRGWKDEDDRERQVVRVYAVSAADGARALEVLTDHGMRPVDPLAIQGPLPRCRAELVLFDEERVASGRHYRIWSLSISVHDDFLSLHIVQRDEDRQAYVRCPVRCEELWATLLRDGWPDRTPDNDPHLVSVRPLFEEWRAITLPGFPFDDGPDGRVWMTSSGRGSTGIVIGPCGGPYERVEIEGCLRQGSVLPDGLSALALFVPPSGPEAEPPKVGVDLVRIDGSAGVRWRTHVGRGWYEHAWQYPRCVDPSGQYVVTQVETAVKVVRLDDGEVIDERRHVGLTVRAWTPEGILASGAAGRAHLWTPGEPPRQAIRRGEFVHPSGRFRLDYDADEDRMDVWEADGTHHVIGSVRGPWPKLRYFPSAWLADDLVLMHESRSDAVLVSLPDGAIHLPVANGIDKPDLYLCTPRTAYSHQERDRWRVSSPRVDPSALSRAAR